MLRVMHPTRPTVGQPQHTAPARQPAGRPWASWPRPCRRTTLTRCLSAEDPKPTSSTRPAYHCDSVTLSLRGGNSVTAYAGTLAVASPVLASLLSKPLARPGVLGLQDGGVDEWTAVLRMIQPTEYIQAPGDVVTWVRSGVTTYTGRQFSTVWYYT